MSGNNNMENGATLVRGKKGVGTYHIVLLAHRRKAKRERKKGAKTVREEKALHADRKGWKGFVWAKERVKKRGIEPRLAKQGTTTETSGNLTPVKV